MFPIWRAVAVFMLLIAGCAATPPAPSPPASTAASAPASTAPPPAIAPAPAKPAAVPVPPSISTGHAAPVDAKAPPKGSPAPPKALALAKPQAAPAAAPKAEAAPALDIKSLEEQLKETKAIGVMTKLALKNQVDDLLQKFRDFYDGRLKTTLADLRQPYELLLMKVITLLQDSDAALAGAIHRSREAIWAVLSDRDKFSKLA
jgi:hypothetical protein